MAKKLKVSVVKYKDRPHWVLRWTDPKTGRMKTKSSGEIRRREAERAAARHETWLKEHKDDAPPPVTWEEFKEAYLLDYVSGLSKSSLSIILVTFKHIERILKPTMLSDLTGASIATWQARLRAEAGLAEATIGVHSRHLKASLRWAARKKYIDACPDIDMPRKAKKGGKMMKGRPITGEEFDRMLLATPKVVGDDAAPSWQRFLKGLWLCGLRLAEAVALSWDSDDPVSIDLTGRHPVFRFRQSGHKAGTDTLCPITPDFAEFLMDVPEEYRHGRVFKLQAHSGSRAPMDKDWVGKVLVHIGKAAGVVVDRGTQSNGKPHVKYASAHDLRRSYGARWARKVMPPALMQLMRHESIETTMKFYVGRNAQDVADQLWTAHDDEKSNILVTLGECTPESPIKKESLEVAKSLEHRTFRQHARQDSNLRPAD
ncbi:MAG: site-specific integrase [Pirellulales bacterium]|nr:site-specific integrase [Pirellulales bacterium]